MKPLWGVGSACALVFLAVDASPARAAWNNVFQVCCNSCRSQPAVSYYAAPAASCDPCPQPVCTTRYVQRCYYQPVTSYESKSYYEQVTSYRTSYYYEPVTSYRYSCYYDPCTCSYQQVACPTTTYRLRSQCCPVTSWVQRCCQVPVTSYRVSSYWEPVTTCCTPQPQCCPTSLNAACPDGGTQQPSTGAAPAVTEQRSNPGVGVQEYRGGAGSSGASGSGSSGSSGSPLYDRYYPPSNNPPPAYMPNVEGSSARPGYAPRLPVTQPPASPKIAVKMDKIVSAPRSDLAGQVIYGNNAPRSNARLMFVSLTSGIKPQQVTSDTTGRFRVTLASGNWLVYLNDGQDKPVFHSKIELKANQNQQVMVVSR